MIWCSVLCSPNSTYLKNVCRLSEMEKWWILSACFVFFFIQRLEMFETTKSWSSVGKTNLKLFDFEIVSQSDWPKKKQMPNWVNIWREVLLAQRRRHDSSFPFGNAHLPYHHRWHWFIWQRHYLLNLHYGSTSTFRDI